MRTTQDLLVDASAFETRARSIQDSPELPDDAGLAEDYQQWFAECLAVLPGDLSERFRGEYEGSSFSPKIRSFLESPRRLNPLFEPDTPLPGFTSWLHPVDRCFAGPLLAQRQLLRESIARRGRDEPDVPLVAVLRRLPRLIKPLVDRRRGAAPFRIDNEYDVQDVIEALLGALFDDVRAEEPTPSHAAGGARIDFLIPRARIAIEVKMTRPTLRPRTVADELAIDIERYRSHPNVDTLIALVFDPPNTIRNRAGFEEDLQRTGPPLTVCVIVVG